MIYYKKRGLGTKFKRFFSNLKQAERKPNLLFAFRGFLVLFFLIIAGLYSSYLFLLPEFLNEENVEAFLNENLKKNSKLILDVENLSVSPDYKLDVVIKADKIKLLYPNKKDFLVLDKPCFDINLITLFQGYLDLNKIKFNNVTLSTNFTKNNKYSALSYINLEGFNFKFRNLQPQLRNINLLSDSVNLKIYDENINKTFYVNSNHLRLVSNSFMNNSLVMISASGDVKTKTAKLSDYNLKLEVKLKDFDTKLINEKLQKLDYNPFLYADKFKCYAKNDINLKINAKNDKPDVFGKVSLTDFSFSYNNIKLPKNNFILVFKGDKISTDIDFRLINDKFIKIKGLISPYKNKFVELKVNSSKIDLSELNFVLAPALKIFNFKDEISLKGSLLMDLYIKSDFKKINSNGKLLITDAKFNNITQGIILDKINTNVSFNNNEINILNSTFELGKEKFYLTGKIDKNSNLNLNVNSGAIEAAKLSSLINSQPFILKLAPKLDAYVVKGGILNLKASLKGNLQKPLLSINSSLKNLRVYLKEQNANLSIQNILINSYDGKEIILTNDNTVLDLNFDSNKSTVKIPKTVIKLDENLIAIDKTKALVDKMPAYFDLKIKNYNSKMPETLFNLDIESLNQNNIISIKNSIVKMKLSAVIKQNKLFISDCRLFNNEEILAEIKGLVSNVNSKAPNMDLRILIDKKLSLIIPCAKNLSFDVSGAINVLGKVSNPDISGDLNLSNINYPELKLKISNLAANIKNKNISFDAKNIILLTEKFDAEGLIKIKNNKPIVASIDIIAGYLNLDNFKNLPDSVTNQDIEIQKLTFSSPLVNLQNINISNVFLSGSFKNDILNLNRIKADLFYGSISGSVNYNIKTQKTKTDLIFRELNVRTLAKVAKEVAPLSFAASGRLDGLTSVEFNAASIKEIIKTLNGYVKFSIKNGELSQFAKLERFLQAGNILSQSILKLSLNSIVSTITKQNTGDFNLLEGSIIIKNSIADIKYIKSQGTNMSLYVTGRFNLLTEISHLRVLGKVPSSIVSVMGNIGNFTTQKLVDKLSDDTKEMIQSLSASPIEKMLSITLDKDELDKIPPLANYTNKPERNFLVVIQGSLQSSSSIKIFKWHRDKQE